MRIGDYGRSLPPPNMTMTEWALFWGTLYGIGLPPGVDEGRLMTEVRRARSLFLAGLLRDLAPGELLDPAALRYELAHIEIEGAIDAGIEAGILHPVYRLGDAEAWTTDLPSLRARPGGDDPAKILVAFRRL